MENVGLFHGHLVYFMAIWYISRPFCILFPVLISCNNKNLASQQLALMAGYIDFKVRSDKVQTLSFYHTFKFRPLPLKGLENCTWVNFIIS
jgi:hypothetical protein